MTPDPHIFQQSVQGVNLQPGTLADQLSTDQPTLLVFLRHFGWIFCREIVRDLREITTQDATYPPVLFFYQGTVEQGKDFFNEFWMEARAVSDANKQFYAAFGVERGTLGQLISPEAIVCGLRSARKGNRLGQIIGDPTIMPGLFVVQGTEVIWQHYFRHVGDHPDLTEIPRLIRSNL